MNRALSWVALAVTLAGCPSREPQVAEPAQPESVTAPVVAPVDAGVAAEMATPDAAPKPSLRSWAEAARLETTLVAAAAMPAAAVAELEALIPAGEHPHKLIWARALVGAGATPAVAFMLEWSFDDGGWQRGEVIYAVARYGGAGFELGGSTRENRGVSAVAIEALADSDVDGDGKPDILLTFDTYADHESFQGLVLFESATLRPSTLRYADRGGEGGEGWEKVPLYACWLKVDKTLGFYSLSRKTETGGKRTKVSHGAAILVQDAAGRFTATQIFAHKLVRHADLDRVEDNWAVLAAAPLPRAQPAANGKTLAEVGTCPGVDTPLLFPSQQAFTSAGKKVGSVGFVLVAGPALSEAGASAHVDGKGQILRVGKQ